MLNEMELIIIIIIIILKLLILKSVHLFIVGANVGNIGMFEMFTLQNGFSSKSELNIILAYLKGK